MKNTKEQGRFRIFFYPYKEEWVGVCPEFGIIHKGKDVFLVKEDLLEAAHEYLEYVRKLKLNDNQLNKKVSLVHYLWFYFNSFKRLFKRMNKRPFDAGHLWRSNGSNLKFC